jgi:hypothetical protein
MVVPNRPQLARRSGSTELAEVLGEVGQAENDDEGDSEGRHIALSICTEGEFRYQSLHRSQISKVL